MIGDLRVQRAAVTVLRTDRAGARRRRRVPWLVVSTALLSAVAYRDILSTLWLPASGAQMAYLALVPVGALLVSLTVDIGTSRRPRARTLPLDFVLGRAVGLVIVLVALTMSFAAWASEGPARSIDRLDLLSLPVFVAGLVALLAGVRRLWTLKTAIFFLFLIWPVPWTTSLPILAAPISRGTAALLAPLGWSLQSQAPAAGSTASADMLSMISTTTTNTLLGFSIAAITTVVLLRGPKRQKALVVAAGFAVACFLNGALVAAIVIAQALVPLAVIPEVLSAAGAMVLVVDVLVMLLVGRRLGLATPRRPVYEPGGEAPEAFAIAPWARSRWTLRAAGPVVAAVIAVLIASANGGYGGNATVSANDPALADLKLLLNARAIPGWSITHLPDPAEASQKFGPQSKWARMLFASTGSGVSDSSRPVYVDAIQTPDASSLAANDIAATYALRHFRLDASDEVPLGAALTGHLVTYFDPLRQHQWSALWWDEPAQTDGGIRYRRVVVFVPDSDVVGDPGAVVEPSIVDSRPLRPTDGLLIRTAQAIIEEQAAWRRSSD